MERGAEMIGRDADAATRLVTGFKSLIDYDNLPSNERDEFDEISSSALHERFPGALLLWPRKGKPTVYYAVAADGAEWRRLRPLLIAYVGPTLTSFNGWLEPLLPHKVPVEAYLQGGNWHTVARLVPGESPNIQDMTRRSLSRMLSMVINAPLTSQSVPKSTSGLLSAFVDCLNGNDYAGAEQVLEICKSELRLDALNLLFLQIRLHAHFKDWTSILQMPQFVSLCHTRKPPLVTATLLEAIFHTKVAKGVSDANAETLLKQWGEEERALTRPLINLPIPSCSGPGTLRLYALEAIGLQDRNLELERAVLQHREAIGDLANMLISLGRTGIDEAHAGHSKGDNALANAQVAMVTAESENTLSSIANALLKIKGLDEATRSQLLASSTFKSLFDVLMVEAGGSAPPINWGEWLERLSDPSFTSAHEALQRAVVEWPAARLIDSTEIAAFTQALANVPSEPPSSERLADALPWLVNWVAADPQFPRAGMYPVYETLLLHLMVGVHRGSSVYDSAAVLIRALLEMCMSPASYKSLLDDVLMLVGEGMGKRMVYWLFDILEETVQNASPSPACRQTFWFACHERLMHIQTYFTPGQRLAFEKLAANLGWPAPSEKEASVALGDERTVALQAQLNSKVVGIYTLTDSAARQAEAALKAIVPSISVLISNDLVGTSLLKNIAQFADILVVVTASAKHAATGFIQQNRPKDKPLLFANGRGFTSIVRAVEEHVLGADR
jgi:hypothetical protein